MNYSKQIPPFTVTINKLFVYNIGICYYIFLNLSNPLQTGYPLLS